MSNLFASVGRVQLRRLVSEFASKRMHYSKLYREKLKGSMDITFLETDLDDTVPHIHPIRVLNGKRDSLRASLQEKGIETGIHYKPNHLLSYFSDKCSQFPITEMLFSELLTLPLHPGLSEDDICYISEAVKDFFKKERAKNYEQ